MTYDTGPCDSEYKIGDRVKVKCPGFGVVNAIIGKIEDSSQRKQMVQILGGPEFSTLLSRLTAGDKEPKRLTTGDNIPSGSSYSDKDQGKERRKRVNRVLPEMNKSDSEESDSNQTEAEYNPPDSCINSESESENETLETMVPPKKKKLVQKSTQKNTEADKAKREELKKKRLAEKAKETTNANLSLMITKEITNPEEKKEMIDFQQISNLEMLENVMDQTRQIMEGQQQLQRKLDDLVSCRQCLKTVYKCIPPKQPIRSPPATPRCLVGQSPCTNAQDHENDRVGSPPMPSRSPVTVHKPVTCTVTSGYQPDPENEKQQDENENDSNHTSQDSKMEASVNSAAAAADDVDDDDDDDLTYLGDAKFGVLVNKSRLQQCEKTSTNIQKLALSCLELVITKEACSNLSIYGKAKGKVALHENKRRALRSHIFKIYGAGISETEKESLWDEVVDKLNCKIRGIRNNKYTFAKF